MAIKYIVNEKERVVVAILENCQNDVRHKILKNIFHYNYSKLYSDLYYMVLTDVLSHNDQIKNVFKAVAKCAPEDTFNIETGKRIAKEKVMKKYYAAHDKALRNVTESMENLANDMRQYTQSITKS